MINMVKFNNATLNDYVIVKRISESVMASVTTVHKTIPGRNGARFVRRQFGPRTIKIDIEIPAASFADREETVQELAAILYTDEEKELELRGSKSYFTILSGNTDLKNLVVHGETSLNFIASDPIAYGNEVSEEDIDGEELCNAGTYPAKGIITVTMDEITDHLEVTLTNTGESLYIDDDFEPGDEVIIDLEKEHITKNGYSAMANLSLESDFFEIPIGKFTVTVSSGTADLQYRERWL